MEEVEEYWGGVKLYVAIGEYGASKGVVKGVGDLWKDGVDGGDEGGDNSGEEVRVMDDFGDQLYPSSR
jgi:hypothetical protein